MQDRIFFSSCFGFVIGVLIRSLVFVNFYFAFLIGVIACALFFFFASISRNNWGIAASMFLLLFSLGILRFHAVDIPPPDIYEQTMGEEISITGKIVDEPDVRENNQKLVVEENVSGIKTKFLVTTNLSEYYKYGDEVNVIGKAEKPENFITDTGKEFDYVNYLRKDGIFYLINYGQVEVVSHGHGNPVKSLLFAVKGKFLEKINFSIPAPESQLMGGLILGERAAFSQDLRQKFIDTGTIHIVALSGYNVTIVAEWIMKMFSFLPRNLGFGAGILGILLFVIMSGGSSTALRAGIMAALVLIARATGRTYDVARALVLAGLTMILLNPFVLVYDVSFQLSFIATVAIIFLAPKFYKYFLWVPERYKLREIFASTCAAYLFVLPFILYKMGNLSLVALPANVLILPFIPFTMALGFLAGFFGIIWHVLAVPFGLISYWLLNYELRVIDFFADFSFASFTIPNFPLVLALSIYAYFIYRLFGRNVKSFFTTPL